jgi:hypothetical protein
LSKGEIFRNIFMIGLSEGLIPLSQRADRNIFDEREVIGGEGLFSAETRQVKWVPNICSYIRRQTYSANIFAYSANNFAPE